MPKMTIGLMVAPGLPLDKVDPSGISYGGIRRGVLRRLYRSALTIYNDSEGEWQAAPDRLIGLATMPSLELEETLAELRRAADAGFKGVILNTWPSGESKPTEADDPFWRLCSEMHMPRSRPCRQHLDELRQSERRRSPR
jgi:predicted TIM-barrel fold metal-dependent hydrolase